MDGCAFILQQQGGPGEVSCFRNLFRDVLLYVLASRFPTHQLELYEIGGLPTVVG